MKQLARKMVLAAGLMAGLYWLPPARSGAGQLEQPHDDPAIGYRGAVGNDPVARLQRQINSGALKLDYSEENGYLASVLKNLRVPVASQGLVFSKTSFQLHRISPHNPRAIFFNDDVYVGWVRGGDVLEVATVDPQLGGVFYMLEQQPAAKPRFVRNDECLQCHASNGTRGVPGFVVRSVYPDERGFPIAPLGGHVTNHASPLKERWGGWYVTGTHGQERHAGNILFSESSNPERPEQLTGANVTSLERKFTPTGYLSTHSDIVALMVLEHQTQMHNVLTRLNYETRRALHHQKVMNEALKQPDGEMFDSTRRRIHSAADEALRYLLFVGEAKFQSPINGTSSFAQEFSAQGPKDKQGRSLRELDLQRKLFRYPCSYLIYSDAFDGLPKEALDYLYRQLWLVLAGQTQDKDFAAIPAAERKAVLEILRATKRNLPDYFQ